ncbi:MAG: hypothetical protein P1U34_04535 [Coxiellaceae bacterium]|nr:hypothetical protein [Coxiellaceae bacterium]
MLFRFTKKNITITCLYVSTCTLIACSPHINPLQTVSQKKAAHVLLRAAITSEKKLKLDPDVPAGALYMDCMQRDMPRKICITLYKAMLSYAKKYPDFKQLTLQDISDKKTYQDLSDEYEKQYFNSGNM